MAEFKCEKCDKTYAHERNLTRHQVEKHGEEKLVGKIVCSECGNGFFRYDLLRNHLETSHSITFEEEVVYFETISDFNTWKINKEREMKCLYVKQSGKKILNTDRCKQYFVCRRSGEFKRRSTGGRSIKSQGSCKTGYGCPSTMLLTTIKNNIFQANLWTPHIGHDDSLSHINLTDEERSLLADLLEKGIDHNYILDSIRDNAADKEELERIDLVCKKDLNNIAKKLSLNREAFHKDDAASGDL